MCSNAGMRSFLIEGDHRRVLERIGLDSLEACLAFEGGVLVKAARKGRVVRRVDWAGRTYFLKRISGFRWREIPHEAEVLARLESEGLPVPTPVAVGSGGRAAAMITLGLPVVRTLEDALVRAPCSAEEAHRLLGRAAELLARLHRIGVNHRDYYAGHLLLDAQDQPMLVDLGRAEVRRRVPERRIVKDLAALEASLPPRVLDAAASQCILAHYFGESGGPSRIDRLARAVKRKRERMRTRAAAKAAAGVPNFHVNS